MKLDYKILWLDDKIDDFRDDEYIDEIRDHLINEEFNPIIHETSEQTKFYKFLDENEYDLILTDFHLNEKRDNSAIDGDAIVESVREKNIFTEILFYTAKAELEGKLKWDRISFLETEGLSDDHHDAVIDKIKKLIDLTIQKFHDIVVMRGMIMNETSDLDNQKLQILKSYIQSSTPETVASLKLDILNEIEKLFLSKLDKINNDWKLKDNGFNKLIKDNFVFSSNYKIKTLGWILSQLGEKDFSEEYSNEIINMRNLFAHANLITDDEGRKFFKKGDTTFDDNYCKTIRRNINKHKQNLYKLESKLNE